MGIVYFSDHGTPYSIDEHHHLILDGRMHPDYTYLGITDWKKADALANKFPKEQRPQALYMLYKNPKSGFPAVEEVPFEKVKKHLNPSLTKRIGAKLTLFEKLERIEEANGKPVENQNIALLFIKSVSESIGKIVMPSPIVRYEENQDEKKDQTQ